MKQESKTSKKNRRLDILVAMLWLFSSGILVAVQVFNQTNLNIFGQLIGSVSVLFLIIYLSYKQHNIVLFPNIQPPSFLGLSYSKTLLLIFGVILISFLLGIIIHPWLVMIAVLSLVAIFVTINQRQYLSYHLVILGIVLGGICIALSALSGRLDGYQGSYLACIPILFIAGSLLAKATGITHIYCVERNWSLALKGFLWASMLALPAALLNISYGAHAKDVWVDQTWEPLVAFVPGIAEEVWARLFLLTLIYSLLCSKSNQLHKRALVAAVLIAAFTHSLAHLPSLMIFSPAAIQALVAGILFGVPMGLLFVKYGFEYAVGYHFFIDFVRFLAAL
jgi:hypothetical protein